MKAKNILLAFLAIAGLALLCTKNSFAQTPTSWKIGDAILKMPTQSIPFEGKKYGVEVAFDPLYSFPIRNKDKAIPDRLYDNIQCTEYTHASINPETWGVTFKKFIFPNSSNNLVAISFGGVSDWRTIVMCIVDPSERILDTLEVTIRVGDPFIKQFRINEKNQIIVTTIKANTSISLPLESFTSFSGYRQDITYSVNAKGRFVEEAIKTYQSRIYTRAYLGNKEINLWEGNEVLQAEKMSNDAINYPSIAGQSYVFLPNIKMNGANKTINDRKEALPIYFDKTHKLSSLDTIISVVNRHLDNGRGIIAGGNYKKRLSNRANDTKETDHSIIIVGRGYDRSIYQVYYTYIDLREYNAKLGRNVATNKLYVDDKSNTIRAAPTNKGKTIEYTLKYIIPNDEITKEQQIINHYFTPSTQ